MSAVKIVINTPKEAPKAKPFAETDGQGRVPYGEAKEVSVPTAMGISKVRGMGAAIKGGSYHSCK